MNSTLLRDRAIVSIAGDDAESLLNRLFTNSMLGMTDGSSRYAALLSPQGKLLFDFLVDRHGAEFWLDCRRDQAADLARKLTMFRLRAKAVIAVRDDLAVAAIWGGSRPETSTPTFVDPRDAALGVRIIAPQDELACFGDQPEAYRLHRVGRGVPEGGVDWPYGDTFVHDANLDLLHGVDFDKGCYVGQEVVSRVHHRGSARKRVVRVHFHGDPPSVGAALTAGAIQIGQITSVAGHGGLATVRIDRLDDAVAAGAPVTAADTLVELTLPASVPAMHAH